MARSKKLVCFYCNKKSNLRFDKQTEWHCSSCEAVNYLDENGDTTDPPVAIVNPGPEENISAWNTELPPRISDSNPFCETCLMNQHKYTSSLRQYPFDLEPTHPKYREEEKAYYKYVRWLNRSYPQVCEDCLPRVTERLNAATKTAKSDYLRRMLERTREKRATPKSYSFLDVFLLLARWLWYIGIAGQLLWNIMALLDTTEVKQAAANTSSYLSMALEFAQPLIAITTSKAWARYSFCCSLATIWWNPKFKEAHKGFMNHVTGYSDWYKLQVLHLVIRTLFVYTMGSGVFSDPNAPATAAFHLMTPVFVLLIAIKSRRALKVDMTRLWKSTPEKIPYVGPSGSPSPQGMGGMGGMSSVLDDIGTTPSGKLPQSSPSPPYLSSQFKSAQEQRSYGRSTSSSIFLPSQSKSFQEQSSYGRPTSSSGISPSDFKHFQKVNLNDRPTTPSSSFPSSVNTTYHGRNTYDPPPNANSSFPPSEVQEIYYGQNLYDPPPNSHIRFHPSGFKSFQKQNLYDRPAASTGMFSTRNMTPIFPDLPQSTGGNYMSMGGPSYQEPTTGTEEMEWTPEIPQKQARAFRPTQPQPKSVSFEEYKQPSPFYGRLPDAPIPPAHRLRNPPNQPRLRVSSQEVKENFFNNMTRRGQDTSPTAESDGESSMREMNLAQQKFFPPEPPSEGNLLVDLLTSFSLSAPEDTPANMAQRSTRMWQGLVVFLIGLFLWIMMMDDE